MNILKGLKEYLKRVLPMPEASLQKRLDELENEIKTNAQKQQELYLQLKQLEEMLEEDISARKADIRDLELYLKNLSSIMVHSNENLTQYIDKNSEENLSYIHEIISDFNSKYDLLSSTIEVMRKRNIEACRNASEAVWAWIFNNTITESLWLKDKTFSPGRWAMGYPNLYVIYRILNEFKPSKILELGLGQSTKMIAQYAAAFEYTEHTVVEHDKSWIDFFCASFTLSERTNILQLEREMVPYKQAKEVRVFKGFRESLKNKKYNFICIDAPLGSDMKGYSRIDILSILPECLDENFVILFDDYDRSAEKNTVQDIEEILKGHNIIYQKGRYSGKKDCAVIASENLFFLTTL